VTKNSYTERILKRINNRGEKSENPGLDQKAIVTDSVAGMSGGEIAEKYGLHPVSVSRVVSQFNRDVPASFLADPTSFSSTCPSSGAQWQYTRLLCVHF
jgi:hypothetical protein